MAVILQRALSPVEAGLAATGRPLVVAWSIEGDLLALLHEVEKMLPDVHLYWPDAS